MSKNVIVSGACGFVGRNLIKSLINQEWQIFALDLKREQFEKNFPNADKCIKFFETDFTKEESIKKVFEQIPSDCDLVHLGGYILGSAGGVDEYDSMAAVDINVKGSFKLVQGLLTKLKSVCVASTLDVYGIPKILPITEEHPVAPVTYYAASKLAMELFLQRELEDKIPLTILRFSHVYGKGDPHPKVLQSFIKTVEAGNAPVINGDGEDRRDYVHVRDVVGSIIAVLNSQSQGVINVASGKSNSLKELALIVLRLAKKDWQPILKDRIQIRKDYVFDITKLNHTLGYQPNVSIEEGIEEILT